MALTRKDFDAITRALSPICLEAQADYNNAHGRGDTERAAQANVALCYLSSAVASVGKGLAETNPKFDPDKFRDAVWRPQARR